MTRLVCLIGIIGVVIAINLVIVILHLRQIRDSIHGQRQEEEESRRPDGN